MSVTILNVIMLSVVAAHNTQHNYLQRNDTQHNNTQDNVIQPNDTQHNNTQHNVTQNNNEKRNTQNLASCFVLHVVFLAFCCASLGWMSFD